MSQRTTKLCSITNCEKNQYARTWCTLHYQRWLKYRDPEAGNSKFMSHEDSFSHRTHWVESCLVWTGAKNADGYGRIVVDGKKVMAHRYAWQQKHGPVPDEKELHHTCYRRDCVNVEHLEIVTRSQNMWNQSGPHHHNTSGYRNVHRHKLGWTVQIRKGNKGHYYGLFDDVEEAAAVAEQARKDLFGDYAGRG